MAQAYKCDRCKDFQEGSPYGDVSLTVRSDDDDSAYHRRGSNEVKREKQLCQSCHRDIAKEIDRTPAREGKQA